MENFSCDRIYGRCCRKAGNFNKPVPMIGKPWLIFEQSILIWSVIVCLQGLA